MNPDTNKFEKLFGTEKESAETFAAEMEKRFAGLLRPDGSPVPEHWSVFTVGEVVTLKNYTFKIAYIGESALLLEPHGPVLVGQDK